MQHLPMRKASSIFLQATRTKAGGAKARQHSLNGPAGPLGPFRADEGRAP